MLERIVHHCLEKDPSARFQSARDIAFALESLSIATSTAPMLATAVPKSKKSWLVPSLSAVIVALVVAVALLLVHENAPSPEPPSYHQLTFGREFLPASHPTSERSSTARRASGCKPNFSHSRPTVTPL
jgi:hypothetical protein